MRYRLWVSTVAVFLLTCSIPFASANSSGINFLDVTVTAKSDAYTNSVSINNNQTIIASSYDNYVELHNSSSLEIIESFYFGREIYHIEFSPDGKYLAISMEASDVSDDSLRLIDVENFTLLPDQERGNNRPGNLDYSPDGSKIIAPNMYNGAQILDAISMDIIASLNGEHTSDVTCTGFSKTGNHAITGDESGKVVLWNSDGTPTDIYAYVEEEVVGCGFSAQDAKFAVSTLSGNISSYSISGSPLKSITLGENHGIKWSDEDDILYVLESDSNPAVIALDGSTFETIHITHLMHKSLDFAIVESNSMLNQIYVATDSNHIALYGSPTYPEGYGLMGSDFDGDKVPDTYDKDDDGDSYEDDYDFNCFNATICSRDPNLETIRSMIFEISENNLVVEDIYTMSQTDTYLFRNLTKRAIISDQVISYEETNMLEDAFCGNMDRNDYVQKLRNSIDLSVGQVSNGTLLCKIIDGLSFTETYDKAQLKFAISTSFDIEPNVTLPLTISLNSQISINGDSITHKMENHPILIKQVNTDDDLSYILWWNSGLEEDPVLNFTKVEEVKSGINSVIDFLKSNMLLVASLLITTVISVWAIIRVRNRKSVILDEAEFEETDTDKNEETLEFGKDNYDNNDDIMNSEPDDITNAEYYSVTDNDQEINVNSISSEERATYRRAFTIDDDSSNSENVVKRRTGKVQRNTEGPIMSTKRKRLDGKLDVPGEQKISKKKVSKIKTRRAAAPAKVRKVRTVKKDD